MKSKILASGLWCLLVPGIAVAVNTDDYAIPYFGTQASLFLPDSVRSAGSTVAPQLLIGVPLESGREAVELRFSDYGYTRDFDGRDDFQTSLFVDYVVDFGALDFGDLKPFVLGGFGFIDEDVRDEKHLHFGANLGGGVLFPVVYKGWGLRLDARVQAQSNNESCDANAGQSGFCADEASLLVDYQLSLGLQIPMTWFYDRPVRAPAAVEECPLAVVDPATGRRDCATDSDKDGIADEVDQCPGSAPGTAVDAQGCAQRQVSNDSDQDGVANTRDECPDTQPGLQVDRRGCVVAQTISLRGVTFEPDSARLTAEGRRTLDGIRGTLAAQLELRVEVAGHTDDVGSETYNLLLSQQRAEAVRDYLIAQGIAEDRLLAVGYGEQEPVASNQSTAGRSANRRVEFRITSE